MNAFGKDFIFNSFSSVVNTPSMTPERTNQFKRGRKGGPSHDSRL